MTTFLFILLTAYVLAITIMFLISARWMPKSSTLDRILTEKALYRNTFVIGGAIIIAIAILITYFVA